jgi:predicted RNase H-like HicB family nuclease
MRNGEGTADAFSTASVVRPAYEAILATARFSFTLRGMTRTLTAVLIREDDGFVALCPEVDVASQGATVEEAKLNLREAVELFFECASESEIESRLSSESFVSSLEIAIA